MHKTPVFCGDSWKQMYHPSWWVHRHWFGSFSTCFFFAWRYFQDLPNNYVTKNGRRVTSQATRFTGQSLKYLPAKRDITRYDPSPSRVTPHFRGIFFWEPLGSVEEWRSLEKKEQSLVLRQDRWMLGPHISHSHCRVPVCPNHMCKHHLHPPCLLAEIKSVEHMAQIGWNMVKEFSWGSSCVGSMVVRLYHGPGRLVLRQNLETSSVFSMFSWGRSLPDAFLSWLRTKTPKTQCGVFMGHTHQKKQNDQEKSSMKWRGGYNATISHLLSQRKWAKLRPPICINLLSFPNGTAGPCWQQLEIRSRRSSRASHGGTMAGARPTATKVVAENPYATFK